MFSLGHVYVTSIYIERATRSILSDLECQVSILGSCGTHTYVVSLAETGCSSTEIRQYGNIEFETTWLKGILLIKATQRPLLLILNRNKDPSRGS